MRCHGWRPRERDKLVSSYDRLQQLAWQQLGLPETACFTGCLSFSGFFRTRSYFQAAEQESELDNFHDKGLHSLFRRGKGGRAQTSARKRSEACEKSLLGGLKALLSQHPIAETASDAGDGGVDEAQLSAALHRIIKRAEKQPGTLLERLRGLIGAAESGTGFGKKKKNKDQPDVANAKGARVVTLQEGPKANSKNEAKAKGKGAKHKNPDQQDWVQVVRKKGATRKGLGSSPGAGHKGPAPKDSAKVTLRSPSWPKGALWELDSLTRKLEVGESPPMGTTVLCRSEQAVENVQRLAKVQQLVGTN